MSVDNAFQTLKPGFSDPVSQSQLVFRRLLDAMARPGTVETVNLDIEGPETLDLAATAIALALVDFETPLYLSPALSNEAAETYLKFHCGTRIVTDVPLSFWQARTKLQRYFPRGIDLVFVSGAEMVAVPRTTNITLQSEKE